MKRAKGGTDIVHAGKGRGSVTVGWVIRGVGHEIRALAVTCDRRCRVGIRRLWYECASAHDLIGFETRSRESGDCETKLQHAEYQDKMGLILEVT
jgi:hypothetical protein